MTPEELLRTRRTVRKFTPEALARATVEELIDLAITAPSASNNQPWRFFAVDDGELIHRMSEAVQRSLDLIAVDGFERYGDYFVRFREAPTVVAVLYRPLAILSNLVSTPEVAAMEQVSGLVSTSLAVQNLLLAAHARGLGASCLTGPLVAAPALKALLDVPEGWQLACLVALGHPAEEPVAPGRKKLSTVLRWVTGCA